MKSMTGFGKAAGTLPDGTEVSVVVKGVNHRFLDLAIKLRDEYAAAEPAIRKAVGRVAHNAVTSTSSFGRRRRAGAPASGPNRHGCGGALCEGVERRFFE